MKESKENASASASRFEKSKKQVALSPSQDSNTSATNAERQHQDPLLSSMNDSSSEPLARQWLHDIYHRGWEAVFGSWLGKYSNPFAFGEQSLSEVVSISRLCGELDSWVLEETEDGDAPANYPSPGTRERSSQIDGYLSCAIEAYAARWLPLAPNIVSPDFSIEDFIKDLWRYAHRLMLKVINRPSYRSMLALLLFALTPIPVGISEEEELDGVSGQVCVHAALQQIQVLRARQKSLQFNGTRVSIPRPRRTSSASPASTATANFINAEGMAYWAALTFDTSASLTLSCRSLLSSGLFGFESEPSWRMVRSSMEVFHQMTKTWDNFEMTDERANQILAAASSWKLYVWKVTSLLKESLRDGHDESEVSRAFNLVFDAIDRFNTTYRDLLSACQRRIPFLSQETKLRWYILVLHCNVCILMVPDIVTAMDREDLLSPFSAKRVDAETWVIDCLTFGLVNRYTLALPPSSSNLDGQPSPPSITVPLVAIDPYPHHVVAAVNLMHQAIKRDFSAGKLGSDAYKNLMGTLVQTLDHLPKCSKSVQAARADLDASQVLP
jgi:hypothetical protein